MSFDFTINLAVSEGLRGLLKYISEQQASIKTKEHNQQVREKGVQKFKAELGDDIMLQVFGHLTEHCSI